MEITLPLEIDTVQVKELLDENAKMLIVDCREPVEYEMGHIATSKLIPIHETPLRVDELEEYRNERIVVYCHHGGRSYQVAHWLRTQGFRAAQSMQGGIDAWSSTIDASIPKY